MGWWEYPYILHLGTINLLSLLVEPAPPEWPYLLRLVTSVLRFLTSTWRFFMGVCSAMLSASLVERQLVYSATC